MPTCAVRDSGRFRSRWSTPNGRDSSFEHRDPFDRMLIAQAQADDLWLVSNEDAFDAMGVRRYW